MIRLDGKFRMYEMPPLRLAVIACVRVLSLLTLLVAADSAVGYPFPPRRHPRGSWSGRSTVGDPEN